MGSTAMKIKGTLKKIEGRVTGDKVREVQGKAQAGAGTVAGKVKRAVKRVSRKARTGKAVASTKAGRKAAAAKLMP